ncbi:hypothetical protein AVEN_274734-1 [Araneus ventricosus]|uniref:Uncharacterized protein n=1 Tax=Araneus ventricosus TaxID=182803 RepID=A0A4Y2S9X7_ARAVE|nr:hypothetical protein AVEN_274734-1 [Araneus ventricosus]
MESLNNNVLSLKDMAMRRMVAALFKESDILASIRNFRRKSVSWNDESLKVWRETVEDKMSDKISKIGLPKSLKKLLIDTSKPMGRHIQGWKTLHEEYLLDSREKVIPFDAPILERLCWTAAGELDYHKTAEELIRSDVIGVVGRYKIACLYCLEDWIPLFWNELPEERKLYFYDERRYCEGRGLRLQFWWPYIIRGEQSKLDSLIRSYGIARILFHQYAFQYSAAIRNKAAAEYFFKKLTQEEREASLIRTTRELLSSLNWNGGKFPKEKASETLCYLLSVMTPDQQMLIFQQDNHAVLECLLHWPLQDRFSEIADLVWNFIPERGYNSVLRKMYENFKNSGHYFQVLFQEFFLRIPSDIKKGFVARECTACSYFDNILCFKDLEALETTFRCVDAATRSALVSSKLALAHFRSSITRGQWDVVAVCLREAMFSKEDRERLKKMSIQTRKWTQFFQFLDESDASGKRCSEDETPTEAKMKKT